MSTTPEPSAATAAIVGDAHVVHAAEAVTYPFNEAFTETLVDGEGAPTPQSWEGDSWR